MNEEEKNKKEKNERTTFVLGIFSAGIVGFILNIFANTYYDLFVTGSRAYSDLNQPSLFFLIIVLSYTIAFLQFLVFDYQNEIKFNHPFMQRFLDYFENIFWLRQLTKKANKIAWLIVKWFIITIFVMSLFKIYGWVGPGVLASFVIVWHLLKYIYRNYYGE